MLEIKNIKRTFKIKKTREIFHALKGVDLKFPNTGFFFIIGKSGSGKSTLLNILGGLDKPTSGEIIIKGKSSNTFKTRDFDSYRNTYLGFIFQDFNMLKGETIGKNVKLALQLQSYKGDMDAKVDEILEEVELLDKKDNKISEISGGQIQRAAIARALVKDPEIIIADEPTGNLDSKTGDAVMKTLKKLSKEKLVIMVTHDVDYADEFADAVIELKDGLIIRNEVFKEKSIAKIVECDSDGEYKKVIRVPKGRRASVDIVDSLNDVIDKNQDEDVFITLSSNKKVLSKYEPKVLELSASQKDKIEKINLNYDIKEEFKLINSKYPLVDAFINGAKNVWERKFNLMFAFVLLVTAISMFGFSTAAQRMSVGNQISDLSEDKGINKISIELDWEASERGVELNKLQNKFEYANLFSKYTTNIQMFSNEDIEGLKLVNNLASIENTNRYVYDFNIGEFPYELEIGNVPTNEQNEYLISSYLADSMIEYSNNYSTYEDLMEVSPIPGMNLAGIYGADSAEIEEIKDILNKNANYYDDGRILETAPDTVKNQLSYALGLRTFYSNIVSTENFEQPLYNYNSKRLDVELENSTKGPIEFTFNRQSHLSNDKFLKSGEVILVVEEGNSVINSSIIDSNVEVLGKLYKVVDVKEEKEYTNEVIYSINDVERLGEYEKGNYYSSNSDDGIVILSGMNSKEKEELINYLISSNDFNMTSNNKNLVENAISQARTFTLMSDVFKYMSYIFSAFSALLLLNQLSSSVFEKKREIGTLRAIGAKGKDVSRIFIFQSLIITVFIAIVSTGFLMYGASLLNSYIAENLGTLIDFIVVDFITVASMFGLAILIGIVAAVLPAKGISFMKPIDAIKSDQ